MAVTGCLGNCIFTVSAQTIKTIADFTWNSGAKWEEHDQHMQSPSLEYTGMDADEITFSIHLSAFSGVDPLEEIRRLFKYERSGRKLSLVLGDKAYGKGKWVIVSTDRDIQQTDGKGNILVADVKLKLKAYTTGNESRYKGN